MKNLDTIASQAKEALRNYLKGVDKRHAGHRETLDAIIAYGKALLAGRTENKSNDEFGKWVVSNGLDTVEPFDDYRERQSAMQITKIVINGGSTVDEFFKCTCIRPIEIMKWVRRQPWFEKKSKSVPKAIRAPKRPNAGRPRKDEPRTNIVMFAGLENKKPKFDTIEEHRKWVDPEFVGTDMDWTDKYGHVQVMTAEQYATTRFTDWATNIKAIAKYAKQLPETKNVDHNWLRKPRERDIARMAEALEYLRPLMAEAEALLARAQALRQPAVELLPTE